MINNNNNESDDEIIENPNCVSRKQEDPYTCNAQDNNELNKLKDKLLRSMAEIENTKERYKKQIEEAQRYSITQLAKDILNIKDSMQNLLKYNKYDNLTEEAQKIYSDLDIVVKEMDSILSKHKIEPIIPNVGDNFDYNLHYAVSNVEGTEYQSKSIVEVMQIGYKIGERLLRPAIVAVAA